MRGRLSRMPPKIGWVYTHSSRSSIKGIEDVPDEAGVYLIENHIDGRCYVGGSVKMRSRIFGHYSKLVVSDHGNEYLQMAWLECGSYSFSVRVLEIVKNSNDKSLIEAVKEREDCWIQRLRSYDRSCGYNIRPSANVAALETKAKLREIKKRVSDETREKLSVALSKSCYRLTSPDGCCLEIRNLKRYCRENNLNYTTVRSVLDKEGKAYNGWKFERA